MNSHLIRKGIVFVAVAAVILSSSLANAADSRQPTKLRLSSQKVQLNKEGKNYQVSAEYPKFFSPSENQDLIRQLNLEVERKVHRLFSTRNRQFVEPGPGLGKDELDAEAFNSVDITSRVIRADDKIVSIEFYRYTYVQGYAHGIMAIFGFNYDVQRRKLIKLEELFDSGADYLKQVSDYCDHDLIRQLGEFWSLGRIGEGDLYQFSVGRRSLSILFSAYQVTSYAGGTPEVRIPFARLKGLRKDIL